MRSDKILNTALGATVFSALIWVGMLAGVSFLATPVKFQAASLSLPVALEVGKVTFGLFSKLEWLLAACLVLSAMLSPPSVWARGLAALLIGAVAFQSAWLLPVLDARIDAIVAGSPMPPSWHHLAYAATEASKAVILCVIAFGALSRIGRGHDAYARSHRCD